MSLEHDTPRFTLDQRDEILNLAARLQVQHETTVGVDELFAEAVAAGIDPRFVQEATLRLGRTKPSRRLRTPFFAFLFFVAQAGLLMASTFGGSSWHDNPILEWPELVVAAALALILGIWAARTPLTRRFVPMSPVAVWLAVALVTLGTRGAIGGYLPSGVVSTALTFGVVQTLVAIFAVIVVRSAEWRPTDGPSSHLYRGNGS